MAPPPLRLYIMQGAPSIWKGVFVNCVDVQSIPTSCSYRNSWIQHPLSKKLGDWFTRRTPVEPVGMILNWTPFMGLFLAHFCLVFFPLVNLSGFSYSTASVLAQDQYLAVPFRGSAALVAGAAWLSGFMGEKKFQNVYTIPIWDSFRMGWPSSIELRLPVYFGISERIWIHLANLMDIRCEDFICLDPVRLKSEGVGILEESNWNTFLPNAWCQWLHCSVARGSTGIASAQEANDIHYCSLISTDIMCPSVYSKRFRILLHADWIAMVDAESTPRYLQEVKGSSFPVLLVAPHATAALEPVGCLGR